MKASASSGWTPAFCGSPPVLISMNRPDVCRPGRFRGRSRRRFFRGRLFNDVKRLDRLARLVALQRADQMKLDRLAKRRRAGSQVAPFGDRFLNAIFAETGLAGGRDRRPDLVSRMGFGDGDKLDRPRLAPAIARPERDGFANARSRPTASTRSHSARPTKFAP